MISFKYKSAVKQIKIKSRNNLEQRMSPWLQEQFNIKNMIVGFKMAGSNHIIYEDKYYDAETFYTNQEKFYGQQVQIIDANDQLEVSFVSQNLNSSSFIRPMQPNSQMRGPSSEELKRQFEGQDDGTVISDIKSFQKKLQDSKDFNILFFIHQLYRKEVVETLWEIRSKFKVKIGLYFKPSNKSFKNPCYTIYMGKKKIIELNLTRQFRQTLQMCIERYSKSKKKFVKDKQKEAEQQVFKTSYEQQNEAPSFTTYQLQERLNQDACLDYLGRMLQQKLLKKYEYTKLCERCEDNYVQFYRIFCDGVIDNDYEFFRNEILLKLDNNLEILLSNVDEMDLSRPISREEQRKQNLKKSVPKIEIVKVENYFQILDQLKKFLSYQTMGQIKAQLLDQSEDIFACFSDFLSRKISRQELAFQLEKTLRERNKRPISRRFPRSANRSRENQTEQINISPIPERAQQIKLMSSQQKIQSKQVPPMFGSSKNNGNFSPIKFMSDIESNYKQAWTKLQKKANSFEPEQYGLLYHFLQTRDDSISNHIQQLQWNEKSSIQKLKEFLSERIKDLFNENFNEKQLQILENMRKSPQIDCIFENFKFQSDLNTFLSCLKDELAHHKGQSQGVENKVLIKKASDSQLLQYKERRKKYGGRRYSDEQQNISSPKGSSFSHPKTSQEFQNLEIFHNLWAQEFEQMLEHCNFTEEQKQIYLRQAFKEGNPSVYLWIHNFCQKNINIIDTSELKKNLKMNSQNKLVHRHMPIYNQILKKLEEDGKITDEIRKWHIAEFIDINYTVISIFQNYVVIKNQEELIQNLKLSFEFGNNNMEYYRAYMKRIQSILKQLSVEDQISMEVFRLYPQKIKAICQLFFISGNVEELLQNLHIIHGIQSNRRKLSCASLNFSGINLNPFQYHDGSKQVTEISNIMGSIIEKEKPYFQGCKLSVIDKKYRGNKVSVRSGYEMLIDGKLPTKEQYLKLWEQTYNNKGTEINGDTEQIIQKSAMFDYFCYVSVVSFLYQRKIEMETYEINDIQSLDGEKLVSFLKDQLSRPSSSMTDKEQIVMDYLFKNNIDVLFLQQAGQINWGQELIKEYAWTKNGDSVIIFKKDKIGQVKMSLQEKYKEELNFNNDTAMFFSERGYLLISGHLTSKSHNVKQAQEMFNTLNKILQEHPLLKIVIGIDANHYMGQAENNLLYTIPNIEDTKTTSTKKRTHLQVQFKKSQMEVSSIKDQILSTLPIKQHSVIVVSGGKPEDGELLPNRRHPYDHFIVTANI